MGSRFRGNDGRGCEASLFPLVPRGMSVTGVSRGDWGWVPAFAGMTEGCDASLFPLVPRGMSVTGVSQGRLGMGSRLRGNDGRGCEASLFPLVPRGMSVTGVSWGGGGWVPAFAGMTGGGEASLFPLVPRGMSVTGVSGGWGGLGSWVFAGMGSRAGMTEGWWRHCSRSCRAECPSRASPGATGESGFPPFAGMTGRCVASLFFRVPRGMSVTGVSRGGWVPARERRKGVWRHCFRSCRAECPSRASPGATGDGFPHSRE